MILSDKQKNEFLVLIGQVFMNIRSLNRNSSTKNNSAETLKLADGFHNIPALLSEKNITSEKLLSEFYILGGDYLEAALRIINNENKTDTVKETEDCHKLVNICLPKNQIQYLTDMVYKNLIDMGNNYGDGRCTLNNILSDLCQLFTQRNGVSNERNYRKKYL